MARADTAAASSFFLTGERVSRFTPRMSLHVDDAAFALAPLAVERLVLGPYLHTAAPGAGVLVPDALERPEQLLAQQLLRGAQPALLAQVVIAHLVRLRLRLRLRCRVMAHRWSSRTSSCSSMACRSMSCCIAAPG